MPEFPDVYADGFSLTAGPYGLTITFTHVVPTGEPGPHEDPAEPVVRLRIGRELAKTLMARRQERQAIAGVAVAGLVRMRPLLVLGPVAACLPEHDRKSMVG